MQWVKKKGSRKIATRKRFAYMKCKDKRATKKNRWKEKKKD
jgi:hypothetical protein